MQKFNKKKSDVKEYIFKKKVFKRSYDSKAFIWDEDKEIQLSKCTNIMRTKVPTVIKCTEARKNVYYQKYRSLPPML